MRIRRCVRLPIVGAVALAPLLGVACADVTVRKVTRENTHGIDGFRYYLPRPYLALKAPMPVAGDEFVVNGTLGADGSVSIPRAVLPDNLRYHFREGSDATAITVAQSELSDGGLPDALRKAADASPLTAASAGSKADSGPQGTAVELADGAMSIVYLPDFDEQYAIKYKAGLGKVDTGTEGLRLRHGWMLDNVSLSIDNVELGKFIFGQADKFTDLISLVGARKNKVLEEFSGTLKKASEREDGPETRAGRSVRLRVTYAIVAQPGLYPLLKPCERGCDCGPVSGMPGSVGSPVTDSRNWVLVPYAPFTSIAYNVKRTVSVELMPLETAPKASPAPGTPSPGAPPNDAAIVRWLRARLTDLDSFPDSRLTLTRADTPQGAAYVVRVTGATAEQVARWSGIVGTAIGGAEPTMINGERVVRITFMP